MNALIIVDMQNDFMEGGALPVPCGKELVPLINEFQSRFDLVVATQDWHPANHGSFAVNHPGKNVFDTIQLGGLPQTLWPVHCVQNTAGADFVPGLSRERWTAVFQKGSDPEIDSYSGFFDNGKRHATGLGDFLRDHGVKSVYVAGVATDYCVKFTALDARALGFPTALIAGACAGVNLNPGDVGKTFEELIWANVDIAKGQWVCPDWDAPK